MSSVSILIHFVLGLPLIAAAALFQGKNEGHFTTLSHCTQAAPLATVSVGSYTFVVSPYAGPNLEVFAEEVLPRMKFNAFILALKSITYDLLTGLDSMHEQVSKGLRCNILAAREVLFSGSCVPLIFPGCR
jgi:hypothetical protein